MDIAAKIALYRYSPIIISVGLLLVVGSEVQAQISPAWLRHWEPYADIRDMDLSPAGNLVITGSDYGESSPFAGQQASDSTRTFLATLNAEGDILWGRRGAFRGRERGTPGWSTTSFAAVTDSRGKIYTPEGYLWYPHSGLITSGGVSVNSYMPDGSHHWTVPVHPAVSNLYHQPGVVRAMDTDPSGNIYIAGFYADTLVLAPDTLYPVLPRIGMDRYMDWYQTDVFLASYSSAGDLRWSQGIGGLDDDKPHWFNGFPFAVHDDGNVYLGGCFRQSAVLGEGQSNAHTILQDTCALASFDSNGAFRWILTNDALDIRIVDGKTVHPFAIHPVELTVTPTGNIYAGWQYSDAITIQVGDTLLDPTPSIRFDSHRTDKGTFIANITPDGIVKWARHIQSDGRVVLADITTDSEGHLYVGGNFEKGARYFVVHGTKFQYQRITTGLDENGFIAHYDTTGRSLWVGHVAGADVTISAMETSPSGDLYIAGKFQENIILGTETREVLSGDVHPFMARYNAGTITAIPNAIDVPKTVVLEASAPNPFRTTTTLSYSLPATAWVSVTVFDMLGRKISTLVNGVQGGGRHKILFDGTGLPAGVYFYRVEALDQVCGGTMILVK